MVVPSPGPAPTTRSGAAACPFRERRVAPRRGVENEVVEPGQRASNEPANDEAPIANTPESVAYNIYVNLAGNSKPIDPTWRPGAG